MSVYQHSPQRTNSQAAKFKWSDATYRRINIAIAFLNAFIFSYGVRQIWQNAQAHVNDD